MTNFLWGNVGAPYNLLTTELNALIGGYGTVYGPEMGGANTAQLGTLHLHLASNSSAFTTSSYLKVFLVPSITLATGTGNYPTYTSGVTPILAQSNYLAGVIYINPQTQSANVVDEVLPNVIIPAGAFKCIVIYNASNPTLPNSGNTLDLYPTPTQY